MQTVACQGRTESLVLSCALPFQPSLIPLRQIWGCGGLGSAQLPWVSIRAVLSLGQGGGEIRVAPS